MKMILIIGASGKPTGGETFSRRTSNCTIVLSILPNTGPNPTPKGKCGTRVRWREERCVHLWLVRGWPWHQLKWVTCLTGTVCLPWSSPPRQALFFFHKKNVTLGFWNKQSWETELLGEPITGSLKPGTTFTAERKLAFGFQRRRESQLTSEERDSRCHGNHKSYTVLFVARI